MYISRRSICIIHVIRIRLKRYLWLKNCFVRINYYRGCFWEYYWNECCKEVSHWICRYIDLLLSQEQNYCCSSQLWTQSPNFSLVIVWLRLWQGPCMKVLCQFACRMPWKIITKALEHQSTDYNSGVIHKIKEIISNVFVWRKLNVDA